MKAVEMRHISLYIQWSKYRVTKTGLNSVIYWADRVLIRDTVRRACIKQSLMGRIKSVHFRDDNHFNEVPKKKSYLTLHVAEK